MDEIMNAHDSLTRLLLFMVVAMGADYHDLLSSIYGMMRMSPKTSNNAMARQT